MFMGIHFSSVDASKGKCSSGKVRQLELGSVDVSTERRNECSSNGGKSISLECSRVRSKVNLI